MNTDLHNQQSIHKLLELAHDLVTYAKEEISVYEIFEEIVDIKTYSGSKVIIDKLAHQQLLILNLAIALDNITGKVYPKTTD